MWCPTQMIVNGEKHDFPLPTAPLETNFPNGQGMIYEVKSVRECLLKGKEVQCYYYIIISKNLKS